MLKHPHGHIPFMLKADNEDSQETTIHIFQVGILKAHVHTEIA